MAAKALVIAGGGMAAARLVACLEEHDFARRSGMPIVVISAETDMGYNRVMLSPLLAGEIERGEVLSPEHIANDHLTVITGETVTRMNRQQQWVETSSGRRVEYARLVLATGSTSRQLSLDAGTPPVTSGIGEFRSLADVDALMARTFRADPVVIAGAGFLGLEAAAGLLQRGAQVCLVQRSQWPLSRQLDEEGGMHLKHLLEARGMSFITGSTLRAVQGDHSGALRQVELNDGRCLDASHLIQALGIVPNIALAQAGGLACHHGILVDGQLRTSDPLIHAVGECIEFEGTTFGLVDPVWQQVEVLASWLSSGEGSYSTRPVATRLKISGIDLFAFGDPRPQQGDNWLRYSDADTHDYRALCINNGRIRCGSLIGDTALGPQWFDHFLGHSLVDEGDDWLFETPQASVTLT